MTAVEEYRCADCGAILAHPGEKHTHEDCCRHWQHRAAKATEYARIEVKRKNEAVERECEAIERAEKAEAALIYDSYGDMVQTWKSRAAALEAARDSERTLRKQAEAELHELTRELEKERETARLRLHFQQRAEAENERLRQHWHREETNANRLSRELDKAEALLRYVLLEDMEYGDRGRERLGALMEEDE